MDYADLIATLAPEFDVPGTALAVLSGDTVEDAATGVVNRRTGVAATPDSLFQIGSVTKVWTTTLVLRLCDQGLLDLNAPVRTYVPELQLRDEHVAAALTVKHLLNHTSGLPGDFFPDTGRGDDCLERYLAVLRDVEVSPPLGMMFSYSNAAFVLAGLVIERVTGGTWDAALRKLIIEPLALPRTVTLPEDALLHRAAVGHLGRGDEQRVAPIWILPRNCGPAGLISATVGDVVEFARLHLTGGLARSGARLLSEESVRLMQDQSVALPAPSQGRVGFGLGWGLGTWNGSAVLQHDGATIGQSAALRVLPEQNVAIALVANGGDWAGFRDAVLNEVTPAVAGVMPPPPLLANLDVTFDPGAYVGVYRNLGAEIAVAAGEGRLVMSVRQLDDIEALAGQEHQQCDLLPHGEDVFLGWLPDVTGPLSVAFLRDADGAVAYVHTGGRASRRLSAAEK